MRTESLSTRYDFFLISNDRKGWHLTELEVPGGQERRLFGVFDGHGGKDVATFAAERIGPEFERQYAVKAGTGAEAATNPVVASPGQKQKKGEKSTAGKGSGGDAAGAALKRAFMTIDKEFLDQHGCRLPTTGSCGLVCYIERGVLWSAIVGDSRY